MIRVLVNGEPRSVPDQSTMADLLKDLNLNNKYCAVEQNREVVPREDHPRTVLTEGDAIEIVTLVGGG